MYAIYFPERDSYLGAKDSEVKVFKTYKWAAERASRCFESSKARVVKIRIVQDETIGIEEIRS